MLRSLVLSGLLASGVGAFASAPFDKQPLYSPTAQAVIYDDEQYKITFNDDETKYRFVNLFNLIPDDITTSNLTIYFELQQSQYTCDFDNYDSTANEYLYIDYNQGESISFFRNDVSYPGYTIYQTQFYSTSFDAFADILTIETTSTYYNVVKSAIELDIQANQSQRSAGFISALFSFVTLLTSGIVTLATGIASGVVGMAKALFLNSTATGLSIFGGLIAMFAGIALAVTLTTKVYQWITSLGN